jgi:hypothetical protein
MVTHRCKRLSKSRSRSEQSTLNSADRRSDDFGYIGIIETLKIAKHENRSSIEVYLTKGCEYISPKSNQFDTHLWGWFH